MPRSKTGKTRKAVDSKQLEKAVNDVFDNRLTIREAAASYKVSKSTIARHIKLFREAKEVTYQYTASNAVKQVFTPEEEEELERYLLFASRLHYGLNKREIRELAYKYATSNDKAIPESWERDKKAGREWLRHFLRRHGNLSLRKAEATSLSRSTSFNKKNVHEFYAKLKSCIEKYQFTPSNIYNVDETSNTTVHVPPRIVAEKGVKQVGAMTSGERGINVTMIAGVSAIGNHVPPMLIFPRVHYKDHMINGAPIGTKGTANPSGWSNEEKFLEYMKHFIEHVKPTKEKPVLLIYDNHESHVSLPVIELAKENGITLLTFPPHTSHKLQPLDRTVFGPYKTYYNQAVSEWMLQNPGRPVTIYQIGEIVGKAYPKAFTQQNITKGFSVTGICPLNTDVFGEDEFLSAFVTDRPAPEADQPPTELDKDNEDAGPSHEAPQEKKFVSPEVIRPFPKAAPRKTVGGRKKGRTRILTESPEKTEIEMNYLKRQAKKNKPKVQKVARKVCEDSSDEENIEVPLQDDSSDDEHYLDKLVEEEFMEQEEEIERLDRSPILAGDFVLVALQGKKSVRHYIAEIKNVVGENDFEAVYLKKVMGSKKFVKMENVYEISATDILRKLPKPTNVGGTERRNEQLSFSIDFMSYNMS